MSQDDTRLDRTSEEIIDVILANPGVKNTDIAERLGIGRSTVQRKLDTEELQFALAAARRDARRIIIAGQHKAAQVLLDQLDLKKNPQVQQNAAKELLKGINPDKVDHSGSVTIVLDGGMGKIV